MTEGTTLPDAGSSDLRAAAEALRSRLPEPLGPLAEIAYNYRWSWTPGGPELFASIDSRRWELSPGTRCDVLQEAHPDRLAALAADERLPRARSTRSSGPCAPSGAPPGHPGGRDHRIARSRSSAPSTRSTARCPSTPAASACWPATSSRRPPTAALPLVAVGLMYRHGYFRQRIDASGWQHEYWVDTDPDRAARRARDRRRRRAAAPSPSRSRAARSSRRSGASTSAACRCYLLDADRPENDRRRPLDHVAAVRRRPRHAARAVRAARHRRRAGARARSASSPASCTSTRATPRSRRSSSRAPRPSTASLGDDALAAARERTVFTTHTPVPAGNDTYPAAQIAEALAPHGG